MELESKTQQFKKLKDQYHALKQKFNHEEFKALKKEFREKGVDSSLEALNIQSYREQILVLGAEINEELKNRTEEKRNA